MSFDVWCPLTSIVSCFGPQAIECCIKNVFSIVNTLRIYKGHNSGVWLHIKKKILTKAVCGNHISIDTYLVNFLIYFQRFFCFCFFLLFGLSLYFFFNFLMVISISLRYPAFNTLLTCLSQKNIYHLK